MAKTMPELCIMYDVL